MRAAAEAAARAGGRVAAAAFAAPAGIRLKADASVVTDADVAAQAAVVAVLNELRPRDRWIGEEAPVDRAPADADTVVWLIDPIDGTRNFVRGSAQFACSVGAMHHGFPVAGAIYDPIRDRMYAADVRSGFFVDGMAAGINARAEFGGPPGELVLAIPSTATPAVAQMMQAAVSRCVVRNTGSAALHLAMIATGEIDAALLATCKLWDLAAGAALIAATGGVFSDLRGAPLFPHDVWGRAAEELPSIAARDMRTLEAVLRFGGPVRV